MERNTDGSEQKENEYGILKDAGEGKQNDTFDDGYKGNNANNIDDLKYRMDTNINEAKKLSINFNGDCGVRNDDGDGCISNAENDDYPNQIHTQLEFPINHRPFCLSGMLFYLFNTT